MQNEQIDVMLAMQDDDFQTILQSDPVLESLEKEKYNKTDEYFELMMILSKIFKIGGLTVSCITPAVWAYLYSIGNAYTRHDTAVSCTDTDIFMYFLHTGLKNAEKDYIEKSVGFCTAHGLDYLETELDLKNMIYLSFRPLEMLAMLGTSTEEERFNADWLTRIISIVCPMTNKTADEILFNMSLTECFYYYIQFARKYDDKGLIKRRNSDEINAAVYKRTFELGEQYYKEHYKDK